MNIIAIIPARGGSKGLPNKNIRLLIEHPLIAYSIKAAITSKYITRTIVSTDSPEIAQIAQTYGAEIPFIRPEAIAGDFSTDLEVFQHALNWLAEHENYRPDLVVQLRPTSPVRQVGIIDRCIQKLIDSTADSLRVVTESPITPYKMWTIEEENKPMTPLLQLDSIDEPYNQPRQKLPKTYWQIGMLDVIRTNIITTQNSMSGKNILPHIVSNEFAVDIDDIESFVKAEKTIKNNPNVIQF